MYKGDALSVSALTGLLIDETNPLSAIIREGRFKILDLNTEVVKPWAIPRQEASDGALIRAGRQQLKVALSHGEEGHLHLLIWDLLQMLHLTAQEILIEDYGGLQIGDCDAQMVDLFKVHLCSRSSL